MLLVELTDRRANRFHATAGTLRQAARNLRLATAGARHAPSAVDDVLALLFRQLAEPRTANDALLVALHEAIDAAAQEADALATVEHQPTAHQAQLAPTRDGLRRNVELLRQLFDRQHLLADVFDVLIGGVRQIFDEQMQIVQQLARR